MATAKDCHTLTSYYTKLYKERYGVNPVVNRHSARWGFDSLLTDMSMTEAKGLLDFFFKTGNTKRHAIDWFLYNYEKLIEAQIKIKEDSEHRATLRKESEQRAKEWREKHGNDGIAGD